MSVKVGQLYASTHGSDVERDQSQRLRVVDFDDSHAVLRFEDRGVRGYERARVRDGRLPGYRLVEEKPETPVEAPGGPCKTCSRLYRGRRVRCPICGFWKALL